MTVSIHTIEIEGVEWTLTVDSATFHTITSPNGHAYLAYKAVLSAPAPEEVQ